MPDNLPNPDQTIRNDEYPGNTLPTNNMVGPLFNCHNDKNITVQIPAFIKEPGNVVGVDSYNMNAEKEKIFRWFKNVGYVYESVKNQNINVQFQVMKEAISNYPGVNTYGFVKFLQLFLDMRQHSEIQSPLSPPAADSECSMKAAAFNFCGSEFAKSMNGNDLFVIMERYCSATVDQDMTFEIDGITTFESIMNCIDGRQFVTHLRTLPDATELDTKMKTFQFWIVSYVGYLRYCQNKSDFRQHWKEVSFKTKEADLDAYLRRMSNLHKMVVGFNCRTGVGSSVLLILEINDLGILHRTNGEKLSQFLEKWKRIKDSHIILPLEMLNVDVTAVVNALVDDGMQKDRKTLWEHLVSKLIEAIPKKRKRNNREDNILVFDGGVTV
ncbi:hypothetical protein HK096_002089 [Nowakowskiella sp. JEL0078]|nr:hypothetical protein HK096_002089 [Nowakowskiella sp. JEL0078]